MEKFNVHCWFMVALLQLTVRELDKIGKKGRSICGPNFCLELLFGPANAKHSPSAPGDNHDSLWSLNMDFVQGEINLLVVLMTLIPKTFASVIFSRINPLNLLYETLQRYCLTVYIYTHIYELMHRPCFRAILFFIGTK